jgi:hypothetical protein
MSEKSEREELGEEGPADAGDVLAAPGLSVVTWTTIQDFWRGAVAVLPPDAQRDDRVLDVLRQLLASGAGQSAKPLSVHVHVDAVGARRAAAKLPEIQAAVPGAPLGYVYSGAVRVGLNRLCAPGRLYSAGEFKPQACEGALAVEVEFEADDAIRVGALAALLDVGLELVAGAALLTGLAMLDGEDVRIACPVRASAPNLA